MQVPTSHQLSQQLSCSDPSHNVNQYFLSMRSKSIRTTGRKRVPELGVSSSDNSDGDAVLVRRGTQRTATPLTSKCFSIPTDLPIRGHFSVIPPSQPGSHVDASERNRFTQSSLPSGRSNTRPLSYAGSSFGAHHERSLDIGTNPGNQAGKLGLRALKPYNNAPIQRKTHTPQETLQLTPRPDSVADAAPSSLVLQQTLPQQPRSSYAARPVKRRPAPSFPTPETSFKPLPSPLDLSFLASGRDQSARLSLLSGPHTAHPLSYVNSSQRSTLSSSQNDSSRDGRHELSQANHVARLEPDVFSTTLVRTLRIL